MGGHVVGLILAGGRSTRMGGQDKSAMPLAGKTLLAHAVERLRPQVDALAISANGDPLRFAEHGLPVLPDAIPGYAGPLGGILAGLDWASGQGAIHMLSAAVDTPFFPLDLAKRLREAASGNPLAVASSGGREHPTFALWPVSHREKLCGYLASRESLRVRDFLAGCNVVHVDFPAITSGANPIDPFFNVNRPEDLAEAERFHSELAK